MKNTLLIILTVIVLIGATFLIDRKTRSANKASAGPAGAAASTDTPEVAPDVTFRDLDGREIKLTDLKGKVVLVNFWATWCEPCRIEIPWMIEFQQKYGPRGFTVVGVSMDEGGKKVVAPWIAEERFDVNGQPMAVNYPIVLGNDEVADAFGGLIGFPTSVLISRDGKVVQKYVGLVNHDKLVKAIEGQL
jgi:cytochrome c biogenesis protein CcmG/thiol:disulfide interchange protein DsbE